MISYEKILQNMINSYFEISGNIPDMDGEIGARLKAVATELCNISAYADQIQKQSSWETATKENLDAIASCCDIQRKSGQKAIGILTFYVNEASENDISIPLGTICSKKTKPFIQYKTTEAVTILAGELSVCTNAEAVSNGDEYNTIHQDIDVMVNPPSGVDGVYNSSKFIGGSGEESDKALRERIRQALSHPQNGVSTEYIGNRIKNLNEVLDCKISNLGESLGIYVRTFNDVISNELMTDITNRLGLYKTLGVEYQVICCEAKYFDVSIKYSGVASIVDVENEFREYAFSLGISEPITIEGYKAFTNFSTAEMNNVSIIVSCDGALAVSSNQYVVLDNLEVQKVE